MRDLLEATIFWRYFREVATFGGSLLLEVYGIKVQLKTIDLSTRLRGITIEFVRFIPLSLELRSAVLGLI